MAEIKSSNEILQLINGLGDNSIVTNVQTTYIVTTEDKVKLLYKEYNEAQEKSNNMFSWFGILVALLIADITCDFKDISFIKAHTVSSFFNFATIICAILFLRSLFYWWKNRKKIEFEFFINQLKGDVSCTAEEKVKSS